MSFKLNNYSYLHKRVRDYVHCLEKVTDSTCKTLDNTFSGFELFVRNDKKCCFIITLERQFYFVSFNDKIADNLYKKIEENIPLVNAILDDLSFLNTMNKYK